MIAFRGVVVDHIQDHSMPAECSVFTMVLNSLTSPGRGISARPAQRSRTSCSPRVAQALLHQTVIIETSVHRHQFHVVTPRRLR